MAEENDNILDPCLAPPVSRDDDPFEGDGGDQNTDLDDNNGPGGDSETGITGSAPEEILLSSVSPDREEFGLHHEEYAAGKSVWLFHSHNLAGEPTDETTYLYSNAKFDPLNPAGIPANVPGPDGRTMIDSFRYVTGKFWKNGIQTFVPNLMAQVEANRRDSISFHNPSAILFRGPQVADHAGAPYIESVSEQSFRQLAVNDGPINPTRFWEKEDLLDRPPFRSERRLGPIRYEPLKLRFPYVFTPEQRWQWPCYLYGRPTLQENGHFSDGTPREMIEQNWRELRDEHRRARYGRLLTYTSDHQNWSTQRSNFSENLFPVIPFYGTPVPWQLESPVSRQHNGVNSPVYNPPFTGRHYFHDYATNFPILFSEKETEDNQLRGAPTISVKGKYNFYSNLYESVVLQNYEERQLPNYYIRRPGAHIRVDEDGHLTAEERISEENLVEVFGILPGRSPFTSSYGDPSSEEFRSVYENDRPFLPMYTDIQITSVEKSLIAQSLREGEDTSAIENIFGILARQGLNRNHNWNAVEQVVESAEDVQELVLSRISSPKIREVWFASLFRDWFNVEGRDLHPVEKFRLLFTKNLMKTRIKNIVKRNERSFMDILRGKPAHSEVVGFKIEKKDAETGETIQVTYLATNDKTEVIKMVDSQVKYSKRYRYTIYQVVVVVGTVYAYSDCMSSPGLVDFWDPTGASQRGFQDFYMGVIHTPSVKILEYPVYSKEIITMDNPPISPNVDVIPFKGDKKRLMFNMDSMTGNFAAKPVVLEPDDVSQFSLIAISQGADPELGEEILNSAVEFKNDDPTQVFEVFRVDREPTSWGSFFQSKIGRVESDATAGSFIDKIVPNKKYWYTFRTEDIHGHVSNPSNIYQIELVSDLDAVYLKSDLFYFPKEERKRTLSFKKDILIEPAFSQKMLDLPADGSFNSWESAPGKSGPVGISDHPVWGKQFKIRITSKSTGKQIDLNFNFTKDYSNIVDR